jgi:hypothetical protein
MYEAHRRGRIVISISPLGENWVVQYLSNRVLPDLDVFEAWVRAGELARLVAGSF